MNRWPLQTHQGTLASRDVCLIQIQGSIVKPLLRDRQVVHRIHVEFLRERHLAAVLVLHDVLAREPVLVSLPSSPHVHVLDLLTHRHVPRVVVVALDPEVVCV